jgi:transposase-like protein
MRNQVAEAHGVARQEQIRRHQLEEDLRRMFLRNMTAMNMEALSLFNFPPEYQKQIDEGKAASLRMSSQVKSDLVKFVEGDKDETPRSAVPIPSAGPTGATMP